MQQHRVIRDLGFAADAGFRPLELDLHLPEGPRPHPVVLELHGGGWLRGSRREFTPLVSEAESFGRIADAGFAVVAASYRLSGEAVFPAQVDDVRRALAWISSDAAAAHGLDPDRVVLWGGSAGGTLAALVGLEPGARVRGVVDWYGPSDLFAMEEHTRSLGVDAPGASREDRWIGGPVPDLPDVARAASPVSHVHPAAPPFHLAHGDADDAVPLAQSLALADALRAVGVEVELLVEPGAGHFWRGVAPERVAALFDAAIRFAARVTATQPTA
ncbi:alpha/beta hydrolase fold domain-containing protein [Agromyces sp. MMS24-JH15]|uniref:alpha/beta hydrolase fold domain-containing protein n=1 Tax=Agromyces sp. MMS24-JH15 TaxID=3243765 RepID=UPI003749BFED